ncbi:protein kinase domain-containing protein [Hyalangium rubrum]|uniref:Protein kinase n=1 Tax=Hyalangium rubrum TaxID=3103134 RepID=A0ABU5H5J6_9BACT|nr:protein kinase [Hyalangium sp. s54d21]MDY7228088.1 protein kinase [Hyalangium sp. s54d21]
MRQGDEHPDERAEGITPAEEEEFEEGDLEDSLLQQVAQVSVPLRVPGRGEHMGGLDGRRFEILEELGGGAMGLVFRARDEELQRVVALKFLLPREGAAEAPMSNLLRQEARAVAQLDHDNIVRIFDVAEWSGAPWEPKVPFLVMECLEGEALSSVVRRERPSLRKAVEMMGAIAAGLAHAHEHHVIHRDLKPGNVFITRKGQVKILDFGLAYLTAAMFPAMPHIPIAGTPTYMAPEQWRGEDQGERTDIWAAGVMLYELITGEPPYPEGSIAELRQRVLSEEPVPSVRALRPEVPEELAQLVAAMLVKQPSGRLQTANEVRERLRRIEETLAPWRDEPRSLGPQRRQVTLVACWLADLAGLAEHLDAEDFGELEGAFHQSCSELLQQHGGSITTCVGDEVLACFGYPQAREEDAEKAARAALALTTHLGTAIQQKLPYLPRRKLTVKVGLHTDTVVLDNLPPELRGHTSALQGEAPKIVHWLARQAAPDTVCLSHTTWRLVRAAFRTEPLGPHSFQGLAGVAKLELHRLVRETPTYSRFERTHAVEPVTPLVGREAELGQLHEHWEEARGGRGRFVLVRGEAGIGKSRLIQEQHERILPGEALRLRCQCWAQFSTSALHPILELLQHLLRLDPEGSPQENLRKLERRMRVWGLPPEHIHLLATFLSLPVAEESPHLRLTPERLKEKTFEALATLLQRTTEERPVFAVVEDLHWADPSTLDLLGFLLERTEKARLCVLLSARPDFRPSWPRRAWLHEVALERLAPHQTADLVRQSASGKSLPEETIEHLVAKTDGIPLFIEEMTRMVMEKPSTPTTTEASSVPLTLSGLLLARLDMLPRRQKSLAQLCAVVGRGFSHALLATLSARNEMALTQDLSGLFQAGLLHTVEDSSGPRYQFRHALLQDAAYQSLLRRTRREYHGRIAHALSAQFPELAETQPEMLAHHYTEAGEVELAIRYWAKAGERASLRSANVEAISHLNQALRLLRGQPDAAQRTEEELRLLVTLGVPLMQTRSVRSREVEQTYDRVMELLRQVEDALPRLHVPTWGSFAYYFMRAKFHVAQELAELVVAQGDRQHSAELIALGHRMMATNCFNRGDMASALTHVERALEFSDFDLEHHRVLSVKEWINPRVAALAYGSVVQSATGREAQARAYGEEAVRLAEQIGHAHTLAFALTYVALGCQLRNEPECARDWVERCIALSSEHRFRLWLGWSVFIKCWVISERGAPAEALKLLQANLGRWRNAGVRAGMPLFLGMLAELHFKLGQFQQGLAAVTHALGWVDALGEHSYEVELHRIEGELLRALGHEPAATVSFMHALDVADRQGAAGFARRARESLERQFRELGGDRPPVSPA